MTGVLNNIFPRHAQAALKKIDGNSVAAHNLFWENGTDSEQSEVRRSLHEDPLLDAEFRPKQSSPVIDCRVAEFTWKGESVLRLPKDTWSGAAPDLGAFEFNPDAAPAEALRGTRQSLPMSEVITGKSGSSIRTDRTTERSLTESFPVGRATERRSIFLSEPKRMIVAADMSGPDVRISGFCRLLNRLLSIHAAPFEARPILANVFSKEERTTLENAKEPLSQTGNNMSVEQ